MKDEFHVKVVCIKCGKGGPKSGSQLYAPKNRIKAYGFKPGEYTCIDCVPPEKRVRYGDDKKIEPEALPEWEKEKETDYSDGGT
jgi:hypothetical protein